MPPASQTKPSADVFGDVFSTAEAAGAVGVVQMLVAAKFLIYGDSGSGKTATAVSVEDVAKNGGEVFVVLTEPNGLTTVHAHNPRAKVRMVEDAATLEQIMLGIESGAFAQRFPDVRRIVFDSATEVLRLKKDAIAQRRTGGRNWQDYKLTTDDYIELAEWGRRWFRRVRNLKYNIVVTALAVSENDTDGNTRKVTPFLQGNKLPAEVMQFFSGVGYAFKRDDRHEKEGAVETVTRYLVLFQGPSQFITKIVQPLRPVEEPNVWAWLNAIREQATGSAIAAGLLAAPDVGEVPLPQTIAPKTPRKKPTPTGGKGGSPKDDDEDVVVQRRKPATTAAQAVEDVGASTPSVDEPSSTDPAGTPSPASTVGDTKPGPGRRKVAEEPE